ncbi:hypothetical protein GALL_518680 [mine drainage metagenome]|uniref:Uncharacterized protein n=1 Tax=mine drainage metagenome TaxID=410659 RepID=A0A1J5P719_9ZZZZ
MERVRRCGDGVHPVPTPLERVWGQRGLSPATRQARPVDCNAGLPQFGKRGGQGGGRIQTRLGMIRQGLNDATVAPARQGLRREGREGATSAYLDEQARAHGGHRLKGGLKSDRCTRLSGPIGGALRLDVGEQGTGDGGQDRDRRALQCTRRDHCRQRRNHRVHHRRMKRVRGLQARVGNALRGQGLGENVNRVGRPGKHLQLRRVAGGEVKVQPGCRCRRKVGHQRVHITAHREHGARRLVLHQAASGGNDGQRRLERHDACNSGRRKLAHRMADQQVRAHPACLPKPRRGDLREVKRGLR